MTHLNESRRPVVDRAATKKHSGDGFTTSIPKPRVVCTIRIAVPVHEGFSSPRSIVTKVQQAPAGSRVTLDLGSAKHAPIDYVDQLAEALRRVSFLEIASEDPNVATKLFADLHTAWERVSDARHLTVAGWDQ